jgi:thiamine-phosphate pyrophosphorylase
LSRLNIHKKRLRGLYAITDERLIPGQHFSEAVELALQGGARIVQYRDKSADQEKRFQQASELRRLCEEYRAVAIINDDIELARAVNADGVHLGKDDISLSEARQLLGDNAIIGVSCYNDLSSAIKAERDTADYVAFGAMFSSSTKPEAVVAGPGIISQAKQQLSIPVCCIGGISMSNIHQLVENGADMTAVISELFSANNIQHAAEQLSQHFHLNYNSPAVSQVF